MKTIPDALRKRHREWIQVVKDGNVDGYCQILTENVVWMPPGSIPIEGRKAFQKWLTPFFNQFSYQFDINDIRLKVSGNRAIERAQFISTMTPKAGGDSMKHAGTFIALWVQMKDSNWYIERYIDDTDL